MRMIGFIKKRVKMFIKRKQNKSSFFAQGCDVSRESNFEGNNYIGQNVLFSGEIGYGSYVGKDSELINVKIGRFSCIGERIKVIDGLHPIEKFVSLHPAFFSSAEVDHRYSFVSTQKFKEHNYVDEGSKLSVDIGSDVWIGSDAKIFAGVKIGDGAVIAAGALVRNNVEPYTIVGGMPAKQLKKRFNEDRICQLIDVRWWDWDIRKIRENAEQFEDIDMFLKLHYIDNCEISSQS